MTERPRSEDALATVTAEEEAFLLLQRTAEALMRALADVLAPLDVTPTQYNMLRILRGAAAEGLSCGEVSARMVARDPDVTRLLDRLETRGLVERARGEQDRRVVVARISRAGLELLDHLDPLVVRFLRARLGHVDREPLRVLASTLEEICSTRE